MAIFKCKMCGGDLEVTEDIKILQCKYCDTKQTLPSADNEKKVNLFNRANRLRMLSEFDKAASIFENIIAEFPEEAEAYWGLCLCDYGIEYVDDPATYKKIPTCHRASFNNLQNDENFKLALEYADLSCQRIYRDEAREIDRIMSEILSVSKNEKPYDVFICYKETDQYGARTIDSVIAFDIYEALTAKGLNVFFSRVSLEDKLGAQYEPYIFAALNSAKVMLSIGTKYEYFQAVWVKNEWSRFLKLMAKDKSKVLIPCFKDMDAYDIPEEFSSLQAQDLNKLGAIQDIVRGVVKIVSPETPIPTQAPMQQAALTTPPKPKAPIIIQNISIIGGRDNDDLWPTGKYSNTINFDQHRYVRFIISVDKKKLTNCYTVDVKFNVFNSQNQQVLDSFSTMAWDPNYDRMSQGWCIRGTDDTTVPVGKYHAAFSINGSEWFHSFFTVTSNEHEQMLKQKQRQQQSAQQLKNNQNAQETLNIMKQRRQMNLCQHCGGGFNGILVKKCYNCGKTKDY